MRKIYISAGTFVALLIGLLSVLNIVQNETPRPISATSSETTIESPKIPRPEIEVKPQSPDPSEKQEAEQEMPIMQPASNVTLSVGNKTYESFIPEGSTVLKMMQQLRAEGLTFVGRDYPSLGMFVESINGKAAETGYVWIFYVNGKEAQRGISQTTLSAGDSIEWKYEKSR